MSRQGLASSVNAKSPTARLNDAVGDSTLEDSGSVVELVVAAVAWRKDGCQDLGHLVPSLGELAAIRGELRIAVVGHVANHVANRLDPREPAMRDLPPIVLGQRVVGETDERKDLISAVHGHALAVWTFDHDVIEATDDVERDRTGAKLVP